MLTQTQIEEYNRIGAIVVQGVLSADELQELRRVTHEFVQNSRTLSTHDEIYDLEDSHSANEPRVRRIKTPHHTMAPTAVWSGTRGSSRCCATCGGRIFASTRPS